MGFLGETFDINDIPEEEKREFEPLPAGWYTATITDAGMRDTKAGTGKFISVRFDITGPNHQGRVVFTNLNMTNPSPKAEEFGRPSASQRHRPATGRESLYQTHG